MNSESLQFLVDQGLTQRQIADRLNSSQGNVKYWLAKFGIKTKTRKPKQLRCKLCGETNSDEFYKHKDGRTRYAITKK